MLPASAGRALSMGGASAAVASAESILPGTDLRKDPVVAVWFRAAVICGTAAYRRCGTAQERVCFPLEGDGRGDRGLAALAPRLVGQLPIAQREVVRLDRAGEAQVALGLLGGAENRVSPGPRGAPRQRVMHHLRVAFEYASAATGKQRVSAKQLWWGLPVGGKKIRDVIQGVSGHGKYARLLAQHLDAITVIEHSIDTGGGAGAWPVDRERTECAQQIIDTADMIRVVMGDENSAQTQRAPCQCAHDRCGVTGVNHESFIRSSLEQPDVVVAERRYRIGFKHGR